MIPPFNGDTRQPNTLYVYEPTQEPVWVDKQRLARFVYELMQNLHYAHRDLRDFLITEEYQ